MVRYDVVPAAQLSQGTFPDVEYWPSGHDANFRLMISWSFKFVNVSVNRCGAARDWSWRVFESRNAELLEPEITHGSTFEEFQCYRRAEGA